MIGQILWRVVQAFLVVLFATWLVFAAVYVLPGDPVSVLSGDVILTPSEEELLRAHYHLDGNLLERYIQYMAGVFGGDFGRLITGKDVGELLESAWPVTVTLALTAWVCEIVIGVTSGVLAGLRPNGLFARVSWGAIILLMGAPTFAVAMLLQYAFGLRLGWFPAAGIKEGWPSSYILPAMCIALLGATSTVRIVRSIVESANETDFVRIARLRGVPPLRIVFHHILRPSTGTLLNHFSLSLAGVLGGVVLVESVFNLPGIGGELRNAINQREATVIVAIVTVLIVVVVVLNLLADILQRVLDPRVRREPVYANRIQARFPLQRVTERKEAS